MHKKIYSVVLFVMFTGAISTAGAQAVEEEAVEVVTTEAVPQKSDCYRFPFAKGCMGFSIGPLLTSDGKNPIYGLGAEFNYFLFDRVALVARGGGVTGGGIQNYYAGPGLKYVIGPFGGYVLIPELVLNREFIRGDFTVDGWAYGPRISLMSRFFGPVYLGISVGYYTFQVPGYKSSDWSWSPVVFIPF